MGLILMFGDTRTLCDGAHHIHGPWVAYVTNVNSSVVCRGCIIIAMIYRILRLMGGWGPHRLGYFRHLEASITWAYNSEQDSLVGKLITLS